MEDEGRWRIYKWMIEGHKRYKGERRGSWRSRTTRLNKGKWFRMRRRRREKRKRKRRTMSRVRNEGR